MNGSAFDHGKIVFETQRLYIRKLTLNDADFMLRLLNSPAWLAYIGDRNVGTLEEAHTYLENGILAFYKDYGFGFWGVCLKANKTLLGICGFMKREYLSYVDIGFAFLPQYIGKGYGYESARAALDYADAGLNLGKICAITSPKNQASHALLEKLGLKHDTHVTTPDGDEVCLYLRP